MDKRLSASGDVERAEPMAEALYNLSDSLRPHLATDDKMHERYEAVVAEWRKLRAALDKTPLTASGSGAVSDDLTERFNAASLPEKLKMVGDFPLPLDAQFMLGEIYADVCALLNEGERS